MKITRFGKIILGIIAAAGLSVSAVGFAAPEPAVLTESVSRRALSASSPGDTYRSGGLLYTELDDGTYEVGYDYDYGKPGSSVTIPSTVNGKTVTRIAESGFYRCHDLEYITLPKTVIGAGENAFTGTKLVSKQSGSDIRYAGHLAVECSTSATDVTIKDGTLGLSDKLFALSPDITRVDLPDSLENLGSNTFAGCSKLRSVNIPSGITEIKDGVFYGCVNVDPYFPKGLTSIGAYAFANSGLSDANMPNVTKIGKGAFENSEVEDSVVVGNGYIEIGAQAFTGTPYYSSLGDVKYIGKICIGAKSSVTSVTLKNGTLGIADMAFTDCTKLQTVTIPAGVQKIGSDAFFACGKLTTVTIGEGLESIGEDAFRLCTRLNTIALPKSLKAVYDGAFYGCSSLSTVNFGGSIIDWAGLAYGVDNSPLLNASITYASEPKTLAPVSGLEVTGSSYDRISFSWTPSAGALVYEIYQQNGSSWKKIDELSGDSTFYTADGLSGNTSYTFRVTAKTGRFTASANVTGTTTFDEMFNLKATPDEDRVSLSWDKNTGAAFYRVEMLSNGEWSEVFRSSNNTTLTCTITGLAPLTEYSFRLYGVSGGIETEPIEVSTATLASTVPEPAGNFTAEPGLNNISLSWEKSALADRYQLEVLKDGRWSVVNSQVTATSYNVTGLNANTEYRFRIFAFNGSKYSRSATVTATTLNDAPDAVENFTATPGANNIALAWDKSALADRYQLEMLRDGRWSVVNSNITTTSYNVTGLNGLTEYRFRIFAFKGSKYSRSTTVSATTLSDTPDAVENFTATPGATNISLSWDISPIADRYQLEVLKDGRWSVVNSKITTTSYNVTGLNGLTEYRFRIFAFCGSKYSRSATVTATTLEVLPPEPVGELTAVPGSNNITLSWIASEGADRYQIEVLRDGRWSVVNSKVTTTAYNITGLNPLTEYRFRIFAFCGAKYSRSATVTATTLEELPPEPVGEFSAVPGANNIALSWTASEGADRYQLEVLRDGRWSVVNSKVTSTSYNVTGLNALTEYRFRIFAFRGSKYSRSATVTATTLTDVPEPVTELEATAGVYNIMLTWTGSELAERYQIEVLKDGRWSVVNSKVTSTSYNVTGLSGLTEYKFRIFAFNGSKYSKSASVTATTLSDVPEAVTNFTAASVGMYNINLTWNRSELADRYQIEVLKDGRWSVVNSKVTSTSYNVTGLSGLTEYKFRIFAFNGSKYSASATVTATTLTDIPDKVTNIAANDVDTTRFTLSWDKSEIADKYRIEVLSGGAWKAVATTAALSYNVTSLLPNTEYRFRVTPMRAAKSGESAELLMKTASKRPDAVENLQAIAKAGSVKLLWERSLLADSYQVEMLRNGVWVRVAKTTATSYNVTGLSEGESYDFRVFAFNYTEYSSSKRITVVTKKSLAPILDLSTQYGDYRLMMKGIDVSGWQGDIDFNAVKKSGVDFVIIKAGYSTSTVDTWETNYKNAKKAGLKVGAYWYSYATTLSQGRSEAKAFIRAMDGKQLDFPVYFDLEESAQFNKGMTFCTNLVEAFCGEVEDAGYLAGVYCSRYWYTNYVAESTRLSRPTWIADYSRACDYGGSYGIWQYGIGSVNGIEGKVDLNWAYTDYSSFIKRNGLNGY